MNTFCVALGLALVAATCVFALELPEVKDQPGTPIDPKQIKNATVTFYNNGTYIYTLEVPCEAYLGQRGGGAGGRQQQQSGRQQQQQPHGDDHENEDDDDDSDEPSSSHSQMTPQQRQQQQQQRQRQQSSQRSGSQSRGGMSPHHEHLGPEELREAHKGTECECQCKNQQGEELDDVIRVSFGGQKGHSSSSSMSSSSSSQRGGSRQDQQQRLQQRNQDRQRQRGGGSSSSGQQKQKKSGSSGEEEGPELVYPEQPRPGQKCIFFEEGEWENDDDELIDAIGPDHKQTGEPEEEVLEKCQFNFKKGGQQQSSSQGGSQQATLQCTDHEGHQDQYVVRIVDGDLKPKLTPQQKQEIQQQKQQKSGGAQRQQRSRQD